MASWRLGLPVCLVAANLYAATIDVSSQSSVALQNGDTLSFAISDWSYQVHVAQFGAPADPSYMNFSWLTEPLTGAPDLGFSLESYDGGVSVAVGDTGLSPGYFQGSLYQGPVSIEYGSLALSPEVSSQLFGGPAVILVIEDMGGDVTLGLPPYLLIQAVEISLSGGGFSVGGTVAAVTLDQALPSEGNSGKRALLLTDGPGNDEPADAPEPYSGALLALGGAVLGLAAHFKRLNAGPEPGGSPKG